jgi:hypothetical protein
MVRRLAVRVRVGSVEVVVPVGSGRQTVLWLGLAAVERLNKGAGRHAQQGRDARPVLDVRVRGVSVYPHARVVDVLRNLREGEPHAHSLEAELFASDDEGKAREGDESDEDEELGALVGESKSEDQGSTRNSRSAPRGRNLSRGRARRYPSTSPSPRRREDKAGGGGRDSGRESGGEGQSGDEGIAGGAARRKLSAVAEESVFEVIMVRDMASAANGEPRACYSLWRDAAFGHSAASHQRLEAAQQANALARAREREAKARAAAELNRQLFLAEIGESNVTGATKLVFYKDSEDLGATAGVDWTALRPPLDRLLAGDATELANVRKVLLQHYRLLRDAYKLYSGLGKDGGRVGVDDSGSNMSFPELLRLLHDARVLEFRDAELLARLVAPVFGINVEYFTAGGGGNAEAGGGPSASGPQGRLARMQTRSALARQATQAGVLLAGAGSGSSAAAAAAAVAAAAATADGGRASLLAAVGDKKITRLRFLEIVVRVLVSEEIMRLRLIRLGRDRAGGGGTGDEDLEENELEDKETRESRQALRRASLSGDGGDGGSADLARTPMLTVAGKLPPVFWDPSARFKDLMAGCVVPGLESHTKSRQVRRALEDITVLNVFTDAVVRLKAVYQRLIQTFISKKKDKEHHERSGFHDSSSINSSSSFGGSAAKALFEASAVAMENKGVGAREFVHLLRVADFLVSPNSASNSASAAAEQGFAARRAAQAAAATSAEHDSITADVADGAANQHMLGKLRDKGHFRDSAGQIAEVKPRDMILGGRVDKNRLRRLDVADARGLFFASQFEDEDGEADGAAPPQGGSSVNDLCFKEFIESIVRLAIMIFDPFDDLPRERQVSIAEKVEHVVDRLRSVQL